MAITAKIIRTQTAGSKFFLEITRANGTKFRELLQMGGVMNASLTDANIQDLVVLQIKRLINQSSSKKLGDIIATIESMDFTP